MPKTPAKQRLGRPFWIYETGQMISTAGDICGNMALAWWILEATGSAQKISAVLAPVILIQTVLTPLLGPLGDRFSRRWLIASSDMLRCFMMAGLAGLAAWHHFSLPAVLSLYGIFGIGAAIFNANSVGVAPQLVSAEVLPDAIRANQSLYAIGRVLGGLVAGFAISWLGVASAFTADAASFGIATLATLATLRFLRASPQASPSPASTFVAELRSGWNAIYRVPLLFWLCIAVAFFILATSPMQVLLPTYVKQVKGMPAWFLGGLESSIGLGVVLGALGLAPLERFARLAANFVLVGLIVMGGAFAALTRVPGILLPIAAAFLIGIGMAWTSIPLTTRLTLVLPDHFRSRISSIIWLFSDGMAPLGVVAGGMLAASVGAGTAISYLGVMILFSAPALFWIPGFTAFFHRPSKDLEGYLLSTYPHIFGSIG